MTGNETRSPAEAQLEALLERSTIVPFGATYYFMNDREQRGEAAWFLVIQGKSPRAYIFGPNARKRALVGEAMDYITKTERAVAMDEHR